MDAAVSTAASDLRHNRVPWISFKLPYSWEEMRDGRGDTWTRQLARRMAKLNGPVWLAFHHEPEGDGDLRAWTAMQARLAPIVRRTAPNVAYSIILTGWNQLYGDRAYSLNKVWPRSTKIDLVGFDVYDKYGVPTEKRSGSRTLTSSATTSRGSGRSPGGTRSRGVSRRRGRPTGRLPSTRSGWSAPTSH